MSADTPIRLERQDDVAILTLCRPDQKNVMSTEMLDTLYAHADALHGDPTVGAVLLQAEGPLFCVGADVKCMAGHMDDLPGYIDDLIRNANRSLLRLMTLPVPTVALLRGTAAGGGASLLLGCDVIVAAKSARLAFAYASLGTTPDLGLSHALVEQLGSRHALQTFLLADSLDMDEARRLNLVQQVVHDDAAQYTALRLASRLASMPSAAAKALFHSLDRHAQLASQLDRERESFVRCCQTDAFRKRVLSFARPRSA